MIMSASCWMKRVVVQAGYRRPYAQCMPYVVICVNNRRYCGGLRLRQGSLFCWWCIDSSYSKCLLFVIEMDAMKQLRY